MTTALPQVDLAVLRVVLQRLTELDGDVHGVTDAVLDHLPYVDAGAAAPTISDIGNGVVEAFTLLTESLEESERQVASAISATAQAATGSPLAPAQPAVERPSVIDLTALERLDRAVR